MQLKKHNYVTWEAHKQESLSIVLYHQAIASAAWLMTVGGRVRLSLRAPWTLRNSLVHCSCATESDGIMESMSGWVPGTWNLWMNTDCHARWDQLLSVVSCSTQFTLLHCLKYVSLCIKLVSIWTPVHSKLQKQYLMLFKLCSDELQMVCILIWNSFHIFFLYAWNLGC